LKKQVIMNKSLNHLGHIAKCPVCDKKYSKKDAMVLEIGQKRNTFHFTCDKCSVSSLVFVSENSMGMVGVGVLTDMTKKEASVFFQNEPVSADNVLEVHNFFKNYK